MIVGVYSFLTNDATVCMLGIIPVRMLFVWEHAGEHGKQWPIAETSRGESSFEGMLRIWAQWSTNFGKSVLFFEYASTGRHSPVT